jgi:hypothetical protein
MAAPPDPIPEYATACLEYVRRALEFELDFSPETLGVLDHYAGTVRATLGERPELAPLIARAMGAYFGEVVRGVIPAFWRIPSLNVHDFQVCSRVAYLSVNPVGVAYDAIFVGAPHDGPRSIVRSAPEDREFLERRLSTLPPVPEDQYYLFTTRLEVLEVANEALSARPEEQGYGGTELTEEDYAIEGAPLRFDS